jgi:hypothetical protein
MEPEVWILFSQESSTSPILSQINPVSTTPPNLFQIHFNTITHLLLGLPSGLFLSGILINILYEFRFSPIHVTCPAHLILLDLIILILLGEESKLWRSALCSFLQPPVISSLFGPNILLNTLFSNILNLYKYNVRSSYIWFHCKKGKTVLFIGTTLNEVCHVFTKHYKQRPENLTF